MEVKGRKVKRFLSLGVLRVKELKADIAGKTIDVISGNSAAGLRVFLKNGDALTRLSEITSGV